MDREKVNDKEREYVYVDYEPKDNEYLKLINMTGKATYKEISEWIDKNYGLNVSNLYIAQVKDKCGFEKKENTNKGTKGSRVPKVTPEKEEAIIAAFRHFNMV